MPKITIHEARCNGMAPCLERAYIEVDLLDFTLPLRGAVV
jgi:hypothetical protein